MSTATQKSTVDLPHDHIHVYRDSPEWANYPRWFMLPAALLQELYVCTYRLTMDSEEGYEDWPVDARAPLDQAEKENPGCVFIY